MNHILSTSKKQQNIERQFADALVATSAFDRLWGISFLGSIDYFNSHHSKGNTKQFSRADHALGVLHLSERLIDQLKIDNLSRMYVVAVALCHDLAHSPFSHSTERAYRKINSNIDHKNILKVILSDTEFGISKLISDFGLDVNRVYEISVNKDDDLSWIFHNPINVDSLDGMEKFLRSFMLIPPFSTSQAIDSLAKLHNELFISLDDVSNLDVFWKIKSSFYESFLKDGVYANFENSYIDRIISTKKYVSISDYLAKESDVVGDLDALMSGGAIGGGRKRMSRSTFKIDISLYPSSVEDLNGRYLRNEKKDGNN